MSSYEKTAHEQTAHEKTALRKPVYRRSPSPAVTRLWILTAVAGLCDFVFGATFVFVMQHEGVEPAAIGTLFAATVIITRAVEAPSGALADRYGHRTVIVAGLALWGGGLVLFGLADDTPWFGAALLAWSAGMAAFSGAPTALVVNHLKTTGAQEAVQIALRGGQVVRWLSSALGAGVVALGGGLVPPQRLITAAGALLVAAAVWVQANWPRAVPDKQLSVGRSLMSGLRLILGRDQVRSLWLSIISAAALSLLIMSWQPVLARYGGFSARSLGLVLLVMTLGSALGAWAARAPRNGNLELLTAGSLAGLLLAAELVGRGLVVTVAALLAAEFFVGTAGVYLSIHIQNSVPDQIRNTTTSLFNTATGLSMGLADLAFGFLWHRLGPAQALHTGGRCLLVLLALYLLLYAVQRHRRQASTSSGPPVPAADRPAPHANNKPVVQGRPASDAHGTQRNRGKDTGSAHP
ncbi:MFS transporter [Streptomyces sp. CL12]|uniref:MFS transporter n=1 Tax=Streptomyces sp. CL12 TaxID=3391744 RepID=UPI003A7F83A9